MDAAIRVEVGHRDNWETKCALTNSNLKSKNNGIRITTSSTHLDSLLTDPNHLFFSLCILSNIWKLCPSKTYFKSYINRENVGKPQLTKIWNDKIYYQRFVCCYLKKKKRA